MCNYDFVIVLNPWSSHSALPRAPCTTLQGLVCNYVIARNPPNQPTSERAIPVAIFRWAPCLSLTRVRCMRCLACSALWPSSGGVTGFQFRELLSYAHLCALLCAVLSAGWLYLGCLEQCLHEQRFQLTCVALLCAAWSWLPLPWRLRLAMS